MAEQQARVKAHDRMMKALEFRKAGLSYEEIAHRTGYKTPQAAWKAVQSALNRSLKEAGEEVRTIELQRLDAMMLPLYARAKKGELGAVDRLLKILERRAKLLGLDAPVKSTADGTVTLTVQYVDKPKQNNGLSDLLANTPSEAE